MDDTPSLDTLLARRLISGHPVEAARLLERLEVQQAVEALLEVEAAAAAAVLRNLERGRAAACLASWPEQQRPGLLAALDPDLAARLLRVLAVSDRAALLSSCPPGVTRPINRLLKYPDQTAGSLMDPNPPAAPEDLTVEAARELSGTWRGRTRGYLYVVDRRDVLVGVMEVDQLLRAQPAATLGALKEPATDRIPARAQLTAVAAHPGWRRHHALPVVDRHEVLVGAIDHRTLHELEGDPEASGAGAPLGLALGEMYWTVISALVEGVVQSLRPADDKPDKEAG